MQAGAAFQAREKEQWVNRILWGELDFEDGSVRMTPLCWSRSYQEWSPETSAFPSDFRIPGEDCWQFELPSLAAAKRSGTMGSGESHNITNLLPDGWISLDKSILNSFGDSLTDEKVISFFDGRIPSWSDALCPRIPRRKIESELVADIVRWKQNPTVTIFLIKGAGGEGKSTLLRQAVCDLIMSNTAEKILWNDGAEGEVPNIMEIHNVMGPCVVVSDDAETIADEVFRLTKIVSKMEQQHICFVLACRDTDWIAAGGDRLPWRTYAQVVDIRLRGLTTEDALLIVEAWGKLGERGLGRLFGRSQEEAVSELLDEARSEAYAQEGAFLGAMLRTRMGADLKAHVKALLVSLGNIKAPGGTLRDAFAYIATPHAENMLTLSKGPLAKAIGSKYEGRVEI
jgi:hypothetical protein